MYRFESGLGYQQFSVRVLNKQDTHWVADSVDSLLVPLTVAPSYSGKYARLRISKHMFDSCRSCQDVVKLETLNYNNVSDVKNPKPVKE